MKTRSTVWRTRRLASRSFGPFLMAMLLAFPGCGGEEINQPAPESSPAELPGSSGAKAEGDASQQASNSEPPPSTEAKTEVARLPRRELKEFAGDWTAHIKPMDVDLALRADARELSGVFRFRGKSIDISETKADGDSLTFLVPIHPSGKIDGDTLVFQLELRDGKLVGTMREKKHPLDQTTDVTWSRKP